MANEPSFSAKLAAGQQKDFGLHVIGLAVDELQDTSGFQNEAVSVSKFSATTSHFSFDERGDGLARVRAVGDRIHAEAEESVHLAVVHVIEHVRPAPVLIGARSGADREFGVEVESPLVFFRRVLAVVRLVLADDEPIVVRHEVHDAWA